MAKKHTENGYMKQLHSSDKADLTWIAVGVVGSLLLAWVLTLVF